MREHFNINGKTVGNRNQPYIIAEMACAHDGDFEKVKTLIDASVDAEADCVQLQLFVADETVTPHHEAYEIVKSIEFSEHEWTELFNYGKDKGIDVFICTYDLPSVELAIKLKADGIKLNSSDLSNPEVLEAVAASGIPFTIGTGASTMEEVRKGVELAKEKGAEKIILMHGVQNFPTKNEDLNIARIDLLRKHFPSIPVGYADHTDGEDPFGKIVDLLAVAKGVSVIEKHITLDRSEKGIDYQAALEPKEFKQFVATIRKAYKALGSNEEQPFTESDLKYRKFQKKSIVAAMDIQAGETINRQKVSFIRNVEPGMPPNTFEQIEGKKAIKGIEKFQNIMSSDIE